MGSNPTTAIVVAGERGEIGDAHGCDPCYTGFESLRSPSLNNKGESLSFDKFKPAPPPPPAIPVCAFCDKPAEGTIEVVLDEGLSETAAMRAIHLASKRWIACELHAIAFYEKLVATKA